jgi:transposase-like protein
MMAGMLTQLPLPLLPAGAEEVAPGVGLVTGDDGGGLVSVHGLATFAWDVGDEAGRRLAAVQLVRLGAVSQVQAAAAFGVDPVTVWRWDQALTAGGVAGLVPARRGPKGASKLTPELAARIRELDAAGARLSQIAAAAGVSTFSVRNALGRVPSRGKPAAGAAAGSAGPAAGEDDQDPDAAVPVLPDPVARDGERALARWGLPDEGAVPVITLGISDGPARRSYGSRVSLPAGSSRLSWRIMFRCFSSSCTMCTPAVGPSEMTNANICPSRFPGATSAPANGFPSCTRRMTRKSGCSFLRSHRK